MAKEYPLCPVCEVGKLSPIEYSDTFQHKGADLCVEGLEGYLCQACGADPIFEEQIRRNHRRVIDAKRAADGLLTGSEIRLLRERLDLTQKKASKLFGGGDNAFSKYERGDVTQSVAMDRLLRIVDRYPFLLGELRGDSALLESQSDRGWKTANTVELSLERPTPVTIRVPTAVSNTHEWVTPDAA